MSYYKGLEYGKKIYLENISKYGFRERLYSQKVIDTCKVYWKDLNVKKTKTGVFLTDKKRLFYKGVMDYLISPGRIRF